MVVIISSFWYLFFASSRSKRHIIEYMLQYRIMHYFLEFIIFLRRFITEAPKTV